MQSSSALFGTFSPLTPTYWADARAQLKNVRMLTLAGIITAASIVLESFPIYLLGTSLKIYFSFLVISLGCYVYGPAVGILVGFANDTLGFLISSFGEPYFPGYLITAMLSGLIYGTLLYRQRITVLRLGEVVGTVNCADTDSQKLAGMMIGHELVTYQYEKKDCTDGEVAVALSHVDYHKESKHNGLNDMSLVVHRGEIVGIAGVDGNGQTQLTQLITGVIAPDSGTLELSGARLAIFDPHGFIKDGVSHVPEDRNLQGLIGDMSIAENLVLKTCATPAFSSGNGLLLKKKAINSYADEMVEKYDIRCTSVEQDVRSLSGGNQQKVIIARELESGPSVLVMAHPTRGLDIGATSFVHDQMIAARARGVGILLISADFDEILEMSDRIVVCFEGRIMGEFSGSKPPINEISLAMTGK